MSDQRIPTRQQDIQEKQAEAMKFLTQGYPGAALKLGKDLWIYEDFEKSAMRYLTQHIKPWTRTF